MSIFTRRVSAAVLVRSLFVQASWNYETLIGAGFAFTIVPVLRALHPTEEAFRAALERHTGLFNSHPYFATVAAGAVARLEKDGVEPALVERFKTALRGSLGSLGDRLIWSAWRPAAVLFGLVLLLAGAVWWLAIVAFLAVYNLLNLALRIWGWSVGTEKGLEVGKALRDAPLQLLASRVADAGAVLGGFATVLALSRQPLRADTLGLSLLAGFVGIWIGARTRQVFAVTLAFVWVIALAWAWSR